MPFHYKLLLVMIGWTLLSIIAYQAGLDAFTSTLKQVHFTQAIAGLCIILFSLFVRGLRWGVIFGHSCGWAKALCFYFANLSYVIFTPLRSGDFFLVPLLKRGWNIPYQESTSKLFIEKVIDFSVIALCSLPLILLQDIIGFSALALLIFILLGVGMTLLRAPLLKILKQLLILQPSQIFILFLLALIAFGLEILGGYVLIDAFFDLKLLDYALIKPAAILFGIITLVPGGVGIESYTLLELFEWRGVDNPQFNATIVSVKMITLSIIVLLGQIVLLLGKNTFGHQSSDNIDTRI